MPLGGSSWVRVAPDPDEVFLCEPCDARVARRADDRAQDPENYYRILGIFRALAGEVWRRGEVSFWFEAPLWPGRSLETPEDEPPRNPSRPKRRTVP